MSPHELCGVKDPNAKWNYLSEDNNMRLRFVTLQMRLSERHS